MVEIELRVRSGGVIVSGRRRWPWSMSDFSLFFLRRPTSEVPTAEDSPNVCILPPGGSAKNGENEGHSKNDAEIMIMNEIFSTQLFIQLLIHNYQQQFPFEQHQAGYSLLPLTDTRPCCLMQWQSSDRPFLTLMHSPMNSGK